MKGGGGKFESDPNRRETTIPAFSTSDGPVNVFAVPTGVSGGTATVAGIGFANETNIVRNVNAMPQFPIGF